MSVDITDARVARVREGVLRVQMRLHLSHSIQPAGLPSCDYKSCEQIRLEVANLMRALDELENELTKELSMTDDLVSRHKPNCPHYRSEKQNIFYLGDEDSYDCCTCLQNFVPAQQFALWAHLCSMHAGIFSPTLTFDELLDLHAHEHDGPGTIRNHPREDRSYSLKKLGEVLSESET